MDDLLEVAADAPAVALFRVAADAVRAAMAEANPARLSDNELLTTMDAIEEAGRLIDAARIATAGEAADRSRPILGHDGLAWRTGCRNGNDLVTRVTRVSGREAVRRIKLGAAVADQVDIVSVRPARFPVVADALARGMLGADAADFIVTGLDSLPPFCTPTEVAVAERALVASATGAITDETAGLPGAGLAFAADLIRGQVEMWKARLNPDGAAPSDEAIEPRSSLGFGRLKDGVYPFRGGATPEFRGVMDTLFDTYLSAHSSTKFPSAQEQARMESGEIVPGAGDADGGVPDGRIPGDTRTTDQKRADILRCILDGAGRDASTPKMGGAAPQVMVHVNAVDLVNDDGVGWVEGVEAPVSMKTVERLICAGGMQTIVLGGDGEILHLGDKERFFTAAQRRAIGARDETCIIPGCNIPARWAEIHHVIPWQSHGATDVDNGVLLCWYHHHTIETSGWLIRMVKGMPEVKAPPWMRGSGQWVRAGAHRASKSRRSALGRT
ncbi:HNH endonuclease signature motif containing protein [Rathayibacter soli]|uniref:HNH endonuclease signature motif containing protein n=1 Tax=Rathayibacter soli TaxID=3144168 RepID=UPI0027E4136A|nr:DUF222 domain-containing protein [Glaciibacter superstes]